MRAEPAPRKPSHAVERTRSDRYWSYGFALLWIVHVAVWTLLPTLTYPNAPIDMIEMLYWGQEWELGYHKHPPLTAWVAEAASQLAGDREWGVYLASQLAVGVCFWAAWRMARELISPALALLSVLLLEGVYYYSLTSAEFNNNVALMPFWALSVWLLYRAIATGRNAYWAGLGVTLGLGLLAKYSLGFLVLPMLAFLALHPSTRRVWRTGGPYWTAAVSFALFSPHLWWMIEHRFISLRYAAGRAESDGQWWDHLLNPLEFGLSQALANLPLLVCAAALIVPRWRLRRLSNHERFARDFLLAMVFGPAALHLLLSLIFGFELRSMWGAPQWTFLGVLLLYSFELRPEASHYWACVRMCGIAATIMIVSSLVQSQLVPFMRGKPSRVHFPGEVLAQRVHAVWYDHYHQPLRIVAGDWWLAGNVCYYSPAVDQVYASSEPGVTDLPHELSPWTSDAELDRVGGVILWDAGKHGDRLRSSIRCRFPAAQTLAPLELDFRTHAEVEPARIGVALVPPDVPSEEQATLARRAE